VKAHVEILYFVRIKAGIKYAQYRGEARLQNHDQGNKCNAELRLRQFHETVMC